MRVEPRGAFAEGVLMAEKPTRIERWNTKLAAVRVEQSRQIEFAGVRLGVFRRLDELGREERRILRQIEKLEAEREKGGA
jgi:hypothetical protein